MSLSVEATLRMLAVLLLGIIMVVIGWYFSFGTDTLQHDWIFFGGGVLTLLSGFATLAMLPIVFRQVKEWGATGIISDAGIVDPPPAEALNAKPSVADTTD